MDVFLVPIGVDAYELYCEHVDEPDAPPEEPASGFWARLNPAFLFRRLKYRFHEMLVEAERERRREHVLTDLRRALALDPVGRLREAEAVASRLRLDHLATFFQRTALSQ